MAYGRRHKQSRERYDPRDYPPPAPPQPPPIPPPAPEPLVVIRQRIMEKEVRVLDAEFSDINDKAIVKHK